MASNDLKRILSNIPQEPTFEPERLTKRPRKVTLLKLQWLAERVRKVERIKKQVAAGTYQVDSSEVAKAILCSRSSRKKLSELD